MPDDGFGCSPKPEGISRANLTEVRKMSEKESDPLGPPRSRELMGFPSVVRQQVEGYSRSEWE